MLVVFTLIRTATTIAVLFLTRDAGTRFVYTSARSLVSTVTTHICVGYQDPHAI